MRRVRKVRAAILLAAVAAMVVIIVVVGKSDPGPQTGTAGAPHTQPVVPTGTPSSATPSPAGERSPEVPTPATPTATPDPHGQHSEPPMVPVRIAATSYLRVFFDRKLPAAQWRAWLVEVSTASHAATLATVPRSAIPNVTLSTIAVVRLASSAATVEATLSDKSVLHVGLVLDETGWKVSRVVPYRKVVTQ